MVSMYTNNGNWNPDPADMACIREDKEYTITSNKGQGNHGTIATTVAVIVLFLFLLVLSLTTALFVRVWLHRRKQDSRSETQTMEKAKNKPDEILDCAHVELHHNLIKDHSTFSLISELQNPLYQNKAEAYDPDASLNLDSLLIQLRVQVTPKWHQFGVVIGVPEDLLQQYSGYPPDECLIEILDYWLKNHHNPTWRDVAKGLDDIKLHELAEDIMNTYKIGRLPVEVGADDMQ